MSAQNKSTPDKRRGRRPGTGTTRQAVLDAARARFAADGFAETTIRRVAADAHVDPSQVMQFFRSKDELFATVMAIPASTLALFDTAFEGPDEHLGERVVRAFLDAWEDSPDTSQPLMAMLRGAITNPHAREQLREFLQSRLLHGISHGIDGNSAGDREADNRTDAALRAGLASAMLVGMIMSRQIIGVPMLLEANPDKVVDLVAPAIQEILAPAVGE